MTSLFMQKIMFRKGRQSPYILFTEQPLKDIQRYCTNGSTPTSFRSILPMDTTFNNECKQRIVILVY